MVGSDQSLAGQAGDHMRCSSSPRAAGDRRRCRHPRPRARRPTLCTVGRHNRRAQEPREGIRRSGERVDKTVCERLLSVAKALEGLQLGKGRKRPGPSFSPWKGRGMRCVPYFKRPAVAPASMSQASSMAAGAGALIWPFVLPCCLIEGGVGGGGGNRRGRADHTTNNSRAVASDDTTVSLSGCCFVLRVADILPPSPLGGSGGGVRG